MTPPRTLATCFAGLALSAAVLLAEEVIELPQFRVDEASFGKRYLYVEVPGFEILSPFDEPLTRLYAKELQRQRAVLSFYIPDTSLNMDDVPAAIILDDKPAPAGMVKSEGRSYLPAASALGQVLAAIRGAATPPKVSGFQPRASTVTWFRAELPDHLMFYVSIHGFDYARQAEGRVGMASRAFSDLFPVSTVYTHRRPQWPGWVEFGLETLGARFYSEQTLEIRVISRLDPPPPGLRIEDAFPSSFTEWPRTTVQRQAAVAFVTWAFSMPFEQALSGTPERTLAFWRFVSDTAHERLTAELFARHFREGDWTDFLRSWAQWAQAQKYARTPTTVATLWPENPPRVKAITPRPATRAELARLKGEYEWRLARELSREAPELTGLCLDQAKRRLLTAYNDGERDPRFLATLALFEADTATAEEAIPYLEAAAATRVVRPMLYYELARIRWELAQRGLPADAHVSVEKVRTALESLNIAHAQAPALLESFRLASAAWNRCEALPTPDELTAVTVGTRLFPRDAVLAYNTALLNLKCGNWAKAEALATEALALEPDSSNLHAPLEKLVAAIHRTRLQQ